MQQPLQFLFFCFFKDFFSAAMAQHWHSSRTNQL
jgi:hypothetical protein